ncbi:hypothetical protein AVEN_53342-1 [Araneus ventricosus]|uniref:Uncharacterized protein n=1 Tax=Araneus ventricosus TaxID=182803 RepID=A0A4Y2AA39_ARAVE|nr:hypothetical protein AVEN_53342-1 [Araneus ventricosus]
MAYCRCTTARKRPILSYPSRKHHYCFLATSGAGKSDKDTIFDSQYDAMAEKCSLCEDYVVTDKCGVGEKGIDGLIKASIARKDGKHELLRGQKKIVLHASCRKKYTRPQSITRILKIAVLDG